MSIRTMTRVWDYSEQDGSRLLLLLALADFSDDEGYCWPKLDVLANKARVSRRTAQYAIEALVGAGELLRTDGRGRGNGATYRVTTGLEGANLAPLDDSKNAQSAARKGAIRNAQKVQPATRKGATRDTHIENRQEPSMGTVKEQTPNPHDHAAPSTSTPSTPTSQAGNPADQVAQRTVPTRGQGNATPSRAPRSTKTGRSSLPEGDFGARGGRWAPVAAAIMGALGRPAPRGKLPAWLGNTVATFGAAAGDDPTAAMVLVAGWAKSRPLREALERGIVRDHTVPALVGSWIVAGNGGQPQAGVARQVDPEERRMQRLGAPDNWRDIVYAPGGVKRSPVLALPRMGLEPYAQQGTWPAWYRAFEGVGS